MSSAAADSEEGSPSRLSHHRRQRILSCSYDSHNAPPQLLPLLQKLKNAYLLWFEHYRTIPKLHRHTLGQRIDAILIETIEATDAALFTPRHEKLPYVRLAIRKLDAVKILLLVLWESKSLDNRKYIAVSEKMNEIGRMLGGWHGQLLKQNSPGGRPGEK